MELERTGENQISLTDPDSRAMAAHTKVGVRYNTQVAVDAKHKVLVEQAATNQVVDMGRDGWSFRFCNDGAVGGHQVRWAPKSPWTPRSVSECPWAMAARTPV